jgi:hypothetical protein
MNPTQIFELCKHLNIFRKLEKKETSQWADICSWPSGTALVRLACVACAAHGLTGPALWPSGTVPPGTSWCTRCSCAGARGVAASEARWHRRVAQGKGTWRRPHRQRGAAQPSQQLLRRAQGWSFGAATDKDRRRAGRRQLGGWTRTRGAAHAQCGCCPR